MTTQSFTSTDKGLLPVELDGAHFHAKCIEALELTEAAKDWHGGEIRYAHYAMNASTDFAEDHEFCCSNCIELFPQIIIDGEWI